MAAHIGIDNKFGLTTPSNGYAHETRSKDSAEWVSTKNEEGITVEQMKLPYTKSGVSMRGVGIPDFSIVAAAAKGDGEVLITEVEGNEENKGDTKFSISGETYTNDDSTP